MQRTVQNGHLHSWAVLLLKSKARSQILWDTLRGTKAMTWLKDSVASAAVEHVPAQCPYPTENSTGYCGRTDIRAWGLCRLHHDRIRKHVHSRCESLGIPPLKRDCTRAQDAKRKQVWREAQDQIPDLPPDPPGDADLNEEARFQSELKEFLEEHGHVVMELPPNFFGPGGGAPDLVIHTKKGRMLIES